MLILETQLGQAIGELQRLSVSERNLIGEVQRLNTLPQQPPPPPPRVQGLLSQYAGVDTRTLGRPDVYHGEEQKWPDWKTILKAYCGVVSVRMATLMTTQETTSTAMIQATLSDSGDQAAAAQLYFILSSDTQLSKPRSLAPALPISTIRA